jgi:hypothetical protein
VAQAGSAGVGLDFDPACARKEDLIDSLVAGG